MITTLNGYGKCFTQVDEILNYLEEDEYKKVPDYVIRIIKENKDNNYQWKYDENKSFKEQEMMRGTLIILSYINAEFLLDDKEKELLNEIHETNDIKTENKCEEHVENIFERKEKVVKNQNENEKIETKLVVPKESLWTKILNFFRKK